MNITTKTKDVEEVITQGDLEEIWEHLKKTFGLNVSLYQQDFLKRSELLNGKESHPELIIEYGITVIQPVLNKMLQRDIEYPTWINLVRFLLKEKLAENSERRNYYRSGVWKGMVHNNANDLHLHAS